MTAKKKRKFINYKVLTSNWIITLTATLVGVLLALYLNETVASNKIQTRKNKATKNIKLEIENNKNSLEEIVENHHALFSTIEFVTTYQDEKERLICPPDTLKRFLKKFPGIFTVTDSIKIDNTLYQYKGDVVLDNIIASNSLSNFTWESVKSSGLSSTYDFDCLILLERLNKYTAEAIEENNKLKELLRNREDFEKIKSQLRYVIDLERILLFFYEDEANEMNKCS